MLTRTFQSSSGMPLIQLATDSTSSLVMRLLLWVRCGSSAVLFRSFFDEFSEFI